MYSCEILYFAEAKRRLTFSASRVEYSIVRDYIGVSSYPTI